MVKGSSSHAMCLNFEIFKKLDVFGFFRKVFIHIDTLVKKYAHSKSNTPVHEWQTLERHSDEVAQVASQFAGLFDSSDWAFNAGWLHDLGKADDTFQAYLLLENGLDDSEYDASGDGKVNHSAAGAALAEEKWGAFAGRAIAYLIAGHHAGLPDWSGGMASWQVRLQQEGKPNLERIRPFATQWQTSLKLISKPSFITPNNFHLWIRLLFSCLVDADFLDTEAFMQEGQPQRGSYLPLSDLAKIFFLALERKQSAAEPTPVNQIRAEIRSTCEEAAEKPSGLFSLTVPTGGGKTLSAMAFAFKHAIKHGKTRIIYVIPYTSIIEQTAQILRDILGEKNVVEHHSNLDPEKETQRSRLASENWDAPIIVTTNVQFFESLYSAKSSRCRKLHNIVNSVVILDEAQLIPPAWLVPCVHVIAELTKHFGVSMVLSTATQPALPGLPAQEMIPPSMRLYERLKRTGICMPDDFQKKNEWAEMAVALQRHEQVLCIVNTRRDCYDLFNLLPEGTIHLSASMCGEHRSQIIATIKEKLKSNAPVRVISTQLVEAGVDIDFPVVYRALAGLDSIAQAAGRCNREGMRETGIVHVFIPPKPAPKGLLRKGADKTKELCSLSDFDPQSPGEYTRYFHLFYSALNDTGKGWLDEKLIRDVPNLAFRMAGEEFQLIEAGQHLPVIVSYGDSKKWIEQVRAIGPKRENMRRLQRYIVNISRSVALEMLADGRIEELEISGKKIGLFIQGAIRYNQNTGLEIFGKGLSPEDYIL